MVESGNASPFVATTDDSLETESTESGSERDRKSNGSILDAHVGANSV